MSNTATAKFIAVEGIEGVGKSSNIQFIAHQLQAAGKPVVTTREPGGTPVAEAVRKILLMDFDETVFPETELLLLNAGRLQHVEHIIKPALQEGKWVICDRFVDATYAYQGGGRGIPLEKITALHHWTLGEFFPHWTIILDAPVDIAFSRIAQSRNLDRFEKEHREFFEKIRHQYLSLASKFPQRYVVVDAAKPLEEVQNALAEIIQRFVREVP